MAIHFQWELLWELWLRPSPSSCCCSLLFAFYRRRKIDFQSGDDITATHSLQFDYETIESATDKFSRSNRLGQGGFGEVYKAWSVWRSGSPLELVDPTCRELSEQRSDKMHPNPTDPPNLSTINLLLTRNILNLPVRLFLNHQERDGLESSQSEDLCHL